MAKFETRLNSFKLLGIALDMPTKKEEKKPVEEPEYEAPVISRREERAINTYKVMHNALREAKIPFETVKRYFIIRYQKPYMEYPIPLYLYISGNSYHLAKALYPQDEESILITTTKAEYVINELNDLRKWM